VHVLKITNKRDVLAGLMFVAIGIAALVFAKDLKMGTAVRMGAGFFPFILTGLLIFLGLVIMGRGLASHEEENVSLAWRPAIVIPAAVAVFAFLISTAGLAIATVVTIILSRLARPGYPWTEAIVLALGAAIVAALVFYYGLGLNLPLWPQLNT
jgi:putative tricarboxylic transport membrane protein